ncbi:MAG: hypothetical protein ACYSYT_06420 [Planctomycetota bacterium]
MLKQTRASLPIMAVLSSSMNYGVDIYPHASLQMLLARGGVTVERLPGCLAGSDILAALTHALSSRTTLAFTPLDVVSKSALIINVVDGSAN